MIVKVLGDGTVDEWEGKSAQIFRSQQGIPLSF
jgi:hypothetical protein